MADMRDTQFGRSRSVRVFVCPDGHIHILGFGYDKDWAEYEMIFGKKLISTLETAAKTIKEGHITDVMEIDTK